MSEKTLIKDGILTDIGVDVKIVLVDAKDGQVHYNPGLARDPDGRLFISVRSCITNQKEYKGMRHPLGYENFLHVGILNEKTLEISGLKEIVPDKDYDWTIWGCEDVRLFWREDGLHGVGVILPLEEGRIKLRQAEILIDYEAGTYSLIKDLGRPFGHAEKNWVHHSDSSSQLLSCFASGNALPGFNGIPLLYYFFFRQNSIGLFEKRCAYCIAVIQHKDAFFRACVLQLQFFGGTDHALACYAAQFTWPDDQTTRHDSAWFGHDDALAFFDVGCTADDLQHFTVVHFRLRNGQVVGVFMRHAFLDVTHNKFRRTIDDDGVTETCCLDQSIHFFRFFIG